MEDLLRALASRKSAPSGERLILSVYSIGILFVGRRYDDAKVIAVADAFQRAAKFDTIFDPLIRPRSDLSDSHEGCDGPAQAVEDVCDQSEVSDSERAKM